MDIIEFLRLVQDECGGLRVELYKTQRDDPVYRKGQAFMNALRGTPYYEKLTGSRCDPFHRDTLGAIYDAIDFVTTKD